MSDLIAPPEVDNLTTFLSSAIPGWEYTTSSPKRFSLLSQHEIDEALKLASTSFERTLGGVPVHGTSFQPRPEQNDSKIVEDRMVALDFDWQGGKAILLCVFDGHAGPNTSYHAADHLPQQIIAAVQALPSSSLPAVVSSTLATAITAYDASLLAHITDLFPLPELASLSDEEVRARVNDGGERYEGVLNALRGSTTVVCLMDPGRRNVWCACLGDSQAVLGVQAAPDQLWETTLLSPLHNGSSPAETACLQMAHPLEPEVMRNGRVLGAIAVTRALGDAAFKLPAVYLEKVFLNLDPPLPRIQARLPAFLPLIKTVPPYLSSTPSVSHYYLPDPLDSPSARVTLLLASDGLPDQSSSRAFPAPSIEAEWVRVLASLTSSSLSSASAGGAEQAGRENVALQMVKSALRGGKDVGDEQGRKEASCTLTVEAEGMYTCDDTTVVVAWW